MNPLEGILLECDNTPLKDYVLRLGEHVNQQDLRNGNLIIFERIDGCQIKYKQYLKHPGVHRVVKMYHYPSLEINNLDCIAGRIHTRHLTDDIIASSSITVNQDDMDKIRPGLSFLHYKRMDYVCNFTNIISAERDIDVYFGGTVYEYRESSKHGDILGNLITKHRVSCIQAINRIGAKISTHSSRTLSAQQYCQRTLHSKIIVSPWGWGEACYRDYEAIILGCEVVKPRTYKIASYPNIYNERFMYFCEPDFSDLEEVIAEIMEKYEGRRLTRIENRAFLLEQRTKKAMNNIIRRIL